MGRISIKEDKTAYQLRREELRLTREDASELLEVISSERIEKIENEKIVPHPDDVLIMAERYNMPNLCNYFCANQCPIGEKYVPEIPIKDLSQIVLEMLASLNSVQERKNRLIEITVDGVIDDNEIPDFVQIQDKLDEISMAVDALQLWAERMVANNNINVEKYNQYKEKTK